MKPSYIVINLVKKIYLMFEHTEISKNIIFLDVKETNYNMK